MPEVVRQTRLREWRTEGLDMAGKELPKVEAENKHDSFGAKAPKDGTSSDVDIPTARAGSDFSGPVTDDTAPATKDTTTDDTPPATKDTTTDDTPPATKDTTTDDTPPATKDTTTAPTDPPPELPPLNFVTSPVNPPPIVIVVDGDGQVLGTAHWDAEAGTYISDFAETTVIEESGAPLPQATAPQLGIGGGAGEPPIVGIPPFDGSLETVVTYNDPPENTWKFTPVDATRQSTDCWHTSVLYPTPFPAPYDWARTGQFGIIISANRIAKDGSKVSAVAIARKTEAAWEDALRYVAEGIWVLQIPAITPIVARAVVFYMWVYFQANGGNEGLSARLC